MSIESGQKNLHEIISELRLTLPNLCQDIAAFIYSRQDETKFAEPLEQLLPIFQHWPTPENIHCITAAKSSEISELAATVNTFSQKTKNGRVTYSIASPLSEQELNADVITETSIAYHALLSGKIASYIFSEDLIAKSIPSPTQYSINTLKLHVGESYVFSDVVEKLVSHGYRRNTQTIEPGSILVRGDEIHVLHPLHSETVIVSFLGNKIDRITSQLGQRTVPLQDIGILPMRFPEETIPCQEALTDRIVVHANDLPFTAKKSIRFNSATRDFSIPKETSEALTFALEHIRPSKKSSTSPVSYEKALELIAQLEEGKPAVHTDHGIGLYEGLQSRTIEAITRDYLVLRYAEGDSISTPVEYAYKITPYIGQSQPIIHRLHGTSWQKTKKKAQHDAAALAKELLRIASSRNSTERTAYEILPTSNEELEKSFPYTLTKDQSQTLSEVLQDLTSAKPMDRLIVGDVGFGKTEIALRAAYHVAKSGKQVVLIAPTTLLVQQHYDVFTSRLSHIASSIHLLSRFTSTADQKRAREAIEQGTAKIVIGTHAALSGTISWKNLGLVVIDEEQRFGVKQKEHFKKLRSKIDVLSLSATPIPRTLSMALSGLRSLSLITTAPQERKGVETYVGKLSDEILTKAITKERNRGGQVYIVAPKIRQLAAIKHQVEELIPDVRISVAHGRLPDDELARIIHSFDSGETDILISSSIVEHGLDLPGANTMIVVHAPHFGLADLYQLRGRIGRRSTQGYAYFLYSQDRLTPIQRQRLAAITEASRLGSGWELARRDLEIRGAGNLLGAEQSGSAEAVGVQLYLDMVRDASAATSTQTVDITDIALPIESVIPTDYIDDPAQRTKWYVRLSRAKDVGSLTERTKELEEEFGTLPLATKNLVLIHRLARIAAMHGITKISSKQITPPDENPYERLILETSNPLPVLEKVSTLGNWRVRNTTLTWDVDVINSELVEKLLSVLQ